MAESTSSGVARGMNVGEAVKAAALGVDNDGGVDRILEESGFQSI